MYMYIYIYIYIYVSIHIHIYIYMYRIKSEDLMIMIKSAIINKDMKTGIYQKSNIENILKERPLRLI
jgi:hypothetical protein